MRSGGSGIFLERSEPLSGRSLRAPPPPGPCPRPTEGLTTSRPQTLSPGVAVVTPPPTPLGRRLLGPRPERVAREAEAGSFRWDPPSPHIPPTPHLQSHPGPTRRPVAGEPSPGPSQSPRVGRRGGSDSDLSCGVEPTCSPRKMDLPGEDSPRVATRGGT